MLSHTNRPSLIHWRLAATCRPAFIFKRLTVARPAGANPCIKPFSTSTEKWSSQVGNVDSLANVVQRRLRALSRGLKLGFNQ
jgi:hypothetical protein